MNADALRIGELLLAQRGMVATAESCTGGLLAECITQIPGASEWFAGGWVTYSNEMKISQLGVDAKIIETHGAVSWQVAKQMCKGAVEQSGATAALSTTGIAGPAGGSEKKPVGTVFIGCKVQNEIQIREFRFHGNRDEIRNNATHASLRMLSRQLSGEQVDSMCCQYGSTIV